MDLADAAHFFGPAVCIQKQFLVLQVVFADIRIRKIFVITLQIYKVKDRLGDWNGSGTFRGTVGSAGIPADQSKQYEILVEKKDMTQAQNVIKIKLS